MSGHLLALVFLLVGAVSAHSKVQYYITPSPDTSCHNDSCLTLSQFASNSSNYTGHISLILLPGNHSLNEELILSGAENFSMEALDNESVIIECPSQSERFVIQGTSIASMRGLNFIGCGGNTVTTVKELTVEDTIFQGVDGEGRGTALVLNEVNITKIMRCSFISNRPGVNSMRYYAGEFIKNPIDLYKFRLEEDDFVSVGGALLVTFSDVSVINSEFIHNAAAMGGVLLAYQSRIHITESTCTYNRAYILGGVMATFESVVNIDNSTFSSNAVVGQKMVAYGGVLSSLSGSLSINRSIFANNIATLGGGVMCTVQGPVSITESDFINNTAIRVGGVMYSFLGMVTIISCNFASNSAAMGDGGVLSVFSATVDIISCTFANNTAVVGGVMFTIFISFNITDSAFSNNKADKDGGVFWSVVGSLVINNSSFNNNSADSHGGVMYSTQSSTHVTDSTFRYNSGSLCNVNGSLTLDGHTQFENCVEPSNKVPSLTIQEGGAITSFWSSVILNGNISFLNNQAKQGGAILAIKSAILLYGAATIANNTATDNNGGGISLQRSDLEVKGNCTISDNHARRGGGVHARSSTITVHQQQGTLLFTNNSAEKGGGLYLEINPKLILFKIWNELNTDRRNLLIFTDNHAEYGGAVYVADDTNYGACSPNMECFVQTLIIIHYADQFFFSNINNSNNINTENMYFSGNTATNHGPNLFGGLLDRCVPSIFAEVYTKQPNLISHYYNGVDYLKNLSNIAAEDSITSPPVRVCFCNSKSEPDCSYQPPPIKVKKGETFTVSLVAVDQVNNSVEANIISSPSSPDGGFGEGQQIQSARKSCTDLIFNVLSPHDNDTINLFADGPCGNSELSIRNLHIQFSTCTCPIGFQPSNSDSTSCECDCDPKLSPEITKCNHTTSSIMKLNANLWITYINDTDPPGYVKYPICPFDYCQPQTVDINFNLPNGANAQCAYNRTGTLCGACQEHLSLSLGSSNCLPCPSHWPAVLAVILLAAIIAGILLVAALLVLNMTVAVGLINSFIFYANIVAANSAVFFPTSEPRFPTVFVAWLNLDLGIDVCFFGGLDTYIKTWLQLAFPVYIISLVVIIIVTSEYSPRFAALIGKRDPIAALATLILLSYAKLLSITITALSFAVIEYPDGSQETVWFPDGNVKYFRGKHTAIVIVALLIILVGVPYTILLLLWQWIVRASRWKVFKWTRNTKLNAFIAVHHVPYNSQYRYWTGLLLLVRVVLYITTAVTVSDNPKVSPLATIFLVGGLIFLNRCIRNLTVYKKSITDIAETILYFNLLALASFSLYDFKTDTTKQMAVAYTSTIITFLLFVGAIVYQVYLLVRKKKTTVELNEYPLLGPVSNSEVTYSIIEIPRRQCPPPGADSDDELDPVSEDCRILTPPYQ